MNAGLTLARGELYILRTMTTYIYETIPGNEGETVKTYEIRQSMKDAALKTHPETGEAIRRVVSGGYGLLRAGGRPTPAPRPPSGGGHCCGGACGCHH